MIGFLGDLWVQLERDDDGASSVPCAAPDGPALATGATGFAESADANEPTPTAPVVGNSGPLEADKCNADNAPATA